MGVGHLKRWHWVVLSIPLGLLAAWAMLSAGPLGMQSQYATMGTEEFESRMLGRPGWYGRAVATAPPLDVRTYPLAEGMYLVTAYLPIEQPALDEKRRWVQRYRAHQIVRGGTYVPVSAMTDPPQFRFKFEERDPLAAMRQREVVKSGWIKAQPGHGGVGVAVATLAFPLRKGPGYELMIRVAPGSEKLGSALQVKLNGQALPALAQDAKEPTCWRAAVPANMLRGGTQELVMTSAGGLVPVGEVELINPRYTVADFVADAKRQNPSLDYSYRYAWDARFAYPGAVLASVIVIGGIWPTLLAILIGAGFGPAVKETAYDLSRFKGGGEEKKAAKKGPTEADQARVRELADDLERKLLAEAQARGPGVETADVPEVQPVKELVLAPVEVPAEGKAEVSKEYGGEYYPVARKGGKHQDE
jgi:hypothetical protein